MELSERKKQILKAIIGDYIRTAEPVGSKALTEGHELPFSSATIRNEMSELEDMGYLEKPHTSAGRIPSPQGYRLYVDELMERPADNAEDGNALQNSVLTKVRELDHLIQEAGKLLTSLTNYASVAITPAMTQIAIRQFEIIAVDKMNFVIVVVTDSGTVKNKMVRTVAEVSKDEAELLTYVLNQTLTGLPPVWVLIHSFPTFYPESVFPRFSAGPRGFPVGRSRVRVQGFPRCGSVPPFPDGPVRPRSVRVCRSAAQAVR